MQENEEGLEKMINVTLTPFIVRGEHSDYQKDLDGLKNAINTYQNNESVFEGLGLTGRDLSGFQQAFDSGEMTDDLLIWGVLSRTATGQVEDEIYGNGIVTEREYNQASGIFERITTRPYVQQESYRDLHYSYNERGSVTAKHDYFQGEHRSISENFSYDEQQRLISWSYNDGIKDITYMQGYSYDNFGNIQTKKINGNVAHNLYYDFDTTSHDCEVSKAPRESGRLIAKNNSCYHYDNNGNITEDANGRNYTWNSFNKIKTIEQNDQNIEFAYTAEGNRVLKRTAEETRYYVSPGYEYVIKNRQKPIEGSATTQSEEVHLEQHSFHNGYEVVATLQKVIDEELITETVKEGEVDEKDIIQDRLVYFHRDLLGSGELITGNNGEVINRRYYSPYGEEVEDLITKYQLEQVYLGHNQIIDSTLNLDEDANLLQQYNQAVNDRLAPNEESQELSIIGEEVKLSTNKYLSSSSTGYRKDELDLDDLRGFTSHEMLEEFGIIHMNARLYDPEIGRFLTADSMIPDASEPLDFNRYMYVRGNPASASDPTGHSLVAAALIITGALLTLSDKSEAARTAGFMAINVGMMVATGGISLEQGVKVTWQQAAVSAGVSSFTTTFVATGADIKASFRSGMISAISAGATTYGAHGGAGAFKGIENEALLRGFHTMIGGIIEEARGGQFAHGALSGFIGKAGGSIAGTSGNVYFKSFVIGISSGLASEATGGKFAHGAMQAAYVYLFNELQEGEGDKVAQKKGEKTAFVGGAMDSRSKIVKRMYDKYEGDKAYFGWTQGKKLAAWIDANQGHSLTVIGHSYGGDTAAGVVANGHYVDNLITVDPVGMFRPSFSKVAQYSGSWTNYNSSGTGITWSNFVATMGRAYNNSPEKYADHHHKVKLNHVDICFTYCRP